MKFAELSLGRVITAPEARGRGLGKDLMVVRQADRGAAKLLRKPYSQLIRCVTVRTCGSRSSRHSRPPAGAWDSTAPWPPMLRRVPPLACPPASSLVDDFTSGSLAPNWLNGGTCLVETGGQLVASVPANAPSSEYCLAFTTARFQLTCDAFTVHVPETTTPILGVQTVIYLGSPTDSVNLLLDTGAFILGMNTDFGTSVTLQGEYDPVADAWWRVGAEESTEASTVYLDTSADGTTWKRRGSLLLPFSLDDIQIGIGAGTYAPVANPGVARFDCFNVPPPCQ
ncbi:MAG: hypothetical protein H0T42_20925 [Deltaproteobacteria bacterium]|nr:hypothetical protein [Deltaproteobacteria bacterium]